MTRTRSLVALASALTALGVAAPAVANAGTGCSVTWGSLPEQSATHTSAPVTGLRSGEHACFDRLVVDVGDGHGGVGFRVGYVDRVVQDGSGTTVPLRGAADLQVVVLAPAHDEDGEPTYDPRRDAEVLDVTGYDTFRQVAWAGSFEGQSTIGLGVRARLPFRVFVLDGPGDGQRLVVDVAHRW
ncbi:AMIN-like domain-containing (lipo)protein [Geodermatophilus marinus]|uniref:AMIN-like domain-containing (lipo)protein n=1 Tax=Geodermatophilus sp. LHW52908 TaxID=2303986 RepID=UPI000E3B6CC0|nr:hypothetical protein [Geodermatophilus sp. LHW52908]RFU22828.1 hypothetical protein D0Z06_02855 [Geodermatophilus sp. LHW52908]